MKCFIIPRCLISLPCSCPPSPPTRDKEPFCFLLSWGWLRAEGRSGEAAEEQQVAVGCWTVLMRMLGMHHCPRAAGTGGEMATAASETRTWYMKTWGIPWDWYHLVHPLLLRGGRAQQAASSSCHGPPNQAPENCLVCFPVSTKCLMDTMVGMAGVSTMGFKHLNPVLPFPQGPWGRHTNQLFLESFILGRFFPLPKMVWVSDFFPTGRAQCCARRV